MLWLFYGEEGTDPLDEAVEMPVPGQSGRGVFGVPLILAPVGGVPDWLFRLGRIRLARGSVRFQAMAWAPVQAGDQQQAGGGARRAVCRRTTLEGHAPVDTPDTRKTVDRDGVALQMAAGGAQVRSEIGPGARGVKRVRGPI